MLKTELLPHQKKTVDFIASKKYVLDASKMGTGKSLSALASIVQANKFAVVVCPPFLCNNWLNEINKHTTLKASAHFLRWSGADVTVVPYTQVEKAEDVFKNCKFWVADEQHYLKNMEAKRTANFHKIFDLYPPEYFVALTGSPIRNRIIDLYSLLVLWSKGPVWPKITEKYRSFYTFACRFTNVAQTQYGVSYSGIKNAEELKEYISGNTIKHDIKLPVKLQETSLIVSYADNPELMEEFKKFSFGKVSTEVKEKVKSACSKAIFTCNFVGSAIDSNEGPVVVFSDHKKPLEIMELELSKYRVKQITGDVGIEKRNNILNLFNNGQLDVLLCTYGAGSTGINLTASNLMVLNDLPWEMASFEQAKKRSHRLGQDKDCRIVHIIGSKIDETILKTLQSKITSSEKVLA